MPELIFGRNPVLEVLRSGKKQINKVILSQTVHGSVIAQIIKTAKEKKIPIHNVPPKKLDSLVKGNNQGVVAEISSQEYLDLEQLIDLTKSKKNAVLVILDSIEDPHNLGAIIRNSVAFGADGIIIGKWRQAGLTQSVLKSSAGASEYIPIARVSNINETINRLKKENFWIIGADIGQKSLNEETFSFPLVLVIGSEGKGLHRLVKERCDILISIPQTKTISSLNASCASAIILYKIFSQK